MKSQSYVPYWILTTLILAVGFLGTISGRLPQGKGLGGHLGSLIGVPARVFGITLIAIGLYFIVRLVRKAPAATPPTNDERSKP